MLQDFNRRQGMHYDYDRSFLFIVIITTIISIISTTIITIIATLVLQTYSRGTALHILGCKKPGQAPLPQGGLGLLWKSRPSVHKLTGG